MSDPSSGKGQKNAKKKAKRTPAPAPAGVLANLPRTRPQRPSARRDASRKAAQAKARPAKTKTAVKPLQEPAPRQGFESDSDPVRGPVQPPGGVDVLNSAAEHAGELTKTGLSTGGRLLKDFLSRLPLN
jgi:hypothetical protein